MRSRSDRGDVWSQLHALAEELHIYEQLRYSRLYEWILWWRNPAYMRQLRADLQFYRQLFGRQRLELVFDVGANVGDKTWVFRKLARRVVCYEPDEKAAHTLRVRFRGDPVVHVETVALSDRPGTSTLHVQEDASAYNTLSAKQSKWVSQQHASGAELRRIEAVTSTLDLAIERHGIPDYIKVDVEGHELEVIKGLSTPCRVISFEANLPLFREETTRIIKILSAFAPSAHYGIRPSSAIRVLDPLDAETALLKVAAAAEPVSWEIFWFNKQQRS